MIKGYCVRCGIWRLSLHRDHIVPKFNGGGDPNYADDVLAKMKMIQDLPLTA